MWGQPQISPKTHPNQTHAFYEHKNRKKIPIPCLTPMSTLSLTPTEVDSAGRARPSGLLHLFHLPDRPERQWQMVRRKYENTKYGRGEWKGRGVRLHGYPFWHLGKSSSSRAGLVLRAFRLCGGLCCCHFNCNGNSNCK